MTDINLKIDSPFLQRLLEVTASGIGAIFRPWMIRRIAQAEADALLTQGTAELQLEALRSESEPLRLALDESTATLDERSEARFRLQERKRQQNIEAVVMEAAQQGGTDPPDEAPDDDWVAQFFTSVQDISNPELRKIWAKLLAGEIGAPGSHSRRTLERLRQLSPQEARLFAEAARLFEWNTGVLLFGSNSGQFLPSRLGTLVEAGLLHPRRMWKLSSPSILVLRYFHQRFQVELKGAGFMDCYDSTSSAGELYSVLAPSPVPDYVDALKEDFRRAGYIVTDLEHEEP